MAAKRANFIDYQQRALAFKVGDEVFPLHADSSMSGRVVALWPAIGMADVEFPNGNKRYPVEELQIATAKDIETPKTESVPSGAGTVPVSVPPPKKEAKVQIGALAERVAKAFVRHAVYWNGPDRKYRASQEEIATRQYICPKCSTTMKPAIYKREEGKSERLLGCPDCLFLVRLADLIGHHSNEVLV